MTLSARVKRLEGRPALVAIAAANFVTGVFALSVLAPLSFGRDAETFREGAIGIAHGTMAYGFLYAPLFGWILTPVTWLAPAGAAIVMSALALGLLLLGVALETRSREPLDRLLITVAVLFYLPVVNEVLLGQVTLLILAAIYPVRRSDGWSRGILLGLVVGLVPKPMVWPILVWMLIWRRRALVAAAVSAGAVTLAGIVLLGPDIYASWLGALVGTGHVSRNANVALTSISQPVVAAVALVTVLAAWLITLRRSEEGGFVASVIVATLAVPFTFAYGLCVYLIAARPASRIAPRAAASLALIANIATFVAALPWALAALAASVVASRPGSPMNEDAPGAGDRSPGDGRSVGSRTALNLSVDVRK